VGIETRIEPEQVVESRDQDAPIDSEDEQKRCARNNETVAKAARANAGRGGAGRNL
jgi:hypothetical protein